MNLKPQQIIGLIAVTLVGGILIVHLIQPMERGLLEGRLSNLPQTRLPQELPLGPARQSPREPAASSAREPEIGPNIPIEPDDSMPGSQEAKDNLYCWAVLSAEFDVRIKTDPVTATPLLSAAKQLEAAGVARLEAEGVTNHANWASLAVSYAEKARADYRRNSLRIPVAACGERASTLSPIDRP